MNYKKEKELSILLTDFEDKLIQDNIYKEVINYKNVNLFDACYTEICREMKKIFLLNHQFQSPVTKKNKSGDNRILLKPYYLLKQYYQSVYQNFFKHNKSSKNKLLVIRTPKNKIGLDILEELKINHGWEIYFASWSSERLKEVRKLNYFNINLNFLKSTDKRKSLIFHKSRILERFKLINFHRVTKNLNNFFQSNIDEPIIEILVNYFSRACSLIDTYEYLNKIVNPDILILLNENILTERVASLYSNTTNLKSVLIQHGIFMGNTYRSFSTDFSLVWGKISKEFLIKRGYHSDKIIEIGYPSISNNVEESINENENDLDSVLFLGQNADNLYLLEKKYKKILIILEKAIKSLPNMKFILRPHPSQKPGYYNNIIKSKHSNLIIDGQKTLNDSFKNVRVIITIFSTAAIEAMKYGIPIITLDTDANNSFSPFLNFSKKAKDSKSLIESLNLLFYNIDERNIFIKKSKNFYHHFVNQDILSPVSYGAKTINEIIK